MPESNAAPGRAVGEQTSAPATRERAAGPSVWRWLARLVLGLAALGFATAVLIGFIGKWHPIGDSFAAFRVPFAACLAVVALLEFFAGSRRIAPPALALAVVALIGPALAMMPGRDVIDDPAFTLYQKNLLFLEWTSVDVADDIALTGADIVTVQELSPRRHDLLDRLALSHPEQITCPRSQWSGVAIASRRPAIASFCASADGLAAIKIDTVDGPIWVVSLHLFWPWPMGQAAQVSRILPVLAALDAPVVIAGDFNMVPWSDSVARITAASATHRPQPVEATFHLLDGIGLPIDHVLVPENWDAVIERRPKLGSDHNGLFATVGPVPST